MKNIIIIVFLLINSISLISQTKEEIHELSKINEIEKKDRFSYVKEYKNEIDFIFSNLFLFYKKYISSQDMARCSFTPSCSEYAIKAIKSQGLIIGVINFFDRFSRCNGINQNYYEKDYELQLLIDPVRNIKYEIVDKE